MSWSSVIVLLPSVAQAVFFAAIGACIGSLTNVLVYRMPLGLSVVKPASRCPSCQTKLTWRENIPIFGWLLLRGRCRFCSVRVSAEYPIVETFVAGLFAGVFALWYLVPSDAMLFGLEIGKIAPAWTDNGALATWPAFVTLLVLLGSLTAMTLIDARTFTIPLVLTWVPAATAVVLLPAHAGWFEFAHGPYRLIQPGYFLGDDNTRWITTPGWTWTLATPSPEQWGWIGAGLGGMLGILLSLLMVRLGIIRRSFEDYEAWEVEAIRSAEAEQAESGEEPTSENDAAQLWIQYPHARREMFIEAAFVSPIVMLSLLGGWGVPRLVSGLSVGDAPLWLTVLGGVFLGYLIGGGIVWSVRIFGSLAFGKEAMGMGDVHLMAAVGACLGWIDSVIGFFGAAFVGLAYTVVAMLIGGKLKRAMPFGPFLAISTLLVLLCRPWIENLITGLIGSATPINLP